MTTTPGEPFPAGAPQPPEPGEELSPAEPPAPSADSPARAPLPRRQPLSLGEEEVPMERLHTEHGRSGTTNTERQTPSDIELGAWLQSLDTTQLMALLAGDVPGDVRALIDASEAHHVAAGNIDLRPSSWLGRYASARLEQLMQQARTPRPEPTDRTGIRAYVPLHAAESPEAALLRSRHALRGGTHSTTDSLEVVEETEGGGTVYRRRPPDDETPHKGS